MKKRLLPILVICASLGVHSCSDSDNRLDEKQERSEVPMEQSNEVENSETEVAKVPTDFVPEEFSTFDKIFGDLNKDGEEDCVIITKGTDPARFVNDEYMGELDRNRRGIIVLFKDGTSYKVASQNDDCFSSENEDGGVYFPPELSVEIKDGKLYLNYGHGRYGYWSYTLRYQNDDFKLIGFDQASHNGPILNYSTSYNFLTGRKLTKRNVNFDSENPENEKITEQWEDFEKGELIRLSEVEDFDVLTFY